MARHQPTLLSTRPETKHLHTWPAPGVRIVASAGYDKQSTGLLSETNSKQDIELFEDSLDKRPEQHFLSPVNMYDYEVWESDSDDDDDDDVELNAGITDFALFDEDRRQARASGQAIPGKWNNMLSSQASALDRAVERTRTEAMDMERTLSTESMPGLTPDGSPHLCDDFEVGSYPGTMMLRPILPDYLKTITIQSDILIKRSSRRQQHVEDDEADITFYVPPRRTQSQPQISPSKLRRPGLRDGRTLSGKEHAWRHPSWEITTVREDPAAEKKAELASS